ncbi:MAG TPA: hypothetical protein VFA63_05920 [Pseudonocardiaceae bacterium]|nr:hypothetical protein [Pseudonocardiaceae bacterium]
MVHSAAWPPPTSWLSDSAPLAMAFQRMAAAKAHVETLPGGSVHDLGVAASASGRAGSLTVLMYGIERARAQDRERVPRRAGRRMHSRRAPGWLRD